MKRCVALWTVLHVYRCVKRYQHPGWINSVKIQKIRQKFSIKSQVKPLKIILLLYIYYILCNGSFEYERQSRTRVHESCSQLEETIQSKQTRDHYDYASQNNVCHSSSWTLSAQTRPTHGVWGTWVSLHYEQGFLCILYTPWKRLSVYYCYKAAAYFIYIMHTRLSFLIKTREY